MREKIKTFKCWNCEETFPEKKFLMPRFPEKEGQTVVLKKSWGFNNVCPECENFLFDEVEKRDKRYNPCYVL